MMRMMFDGFIGRTASLGSPGVNEVRWLAPLRPGDDLTLDVDVAEARVSNSRPETGIVTFKGMVAQRGRRSRCARWCRRSSCGGAPTPLRSRTGDAFLRGYGNRRSGASSVRSPSPPSDIKQFAAQFDPQRFHLDEEEGRKSLFGGLAASGWHVGSVCMKLLVADGQRLARGGRRARREGRGVGTVAGLSRTALDQAGAGRRHHQLSPARSKRSGPRRSGRNGASCRPATPAPTSAASWCSRSWRPPSCRGGTPSVAESTWLTNVR